MYEDEHLLVLHKPAGLLCVPGRGEDKQDCLSARAQQRWPGALIVHRLDQATSGLVLMARHIDAQRRLSHAFAERQVHKRYQAVVWGLLAAQEGAWNEINLPIAADWERRPLRVIDPAHGKPSLTRWRLLGHHPANGTSRIELEPVTGRTHQLRVHMAEMKCPIVGDGKYGGGAAHIKGGVELSGRLHLQAWRIHLPPMFGKGERSFEAPIAPHIAASLDGLGLSVGE